MRTIAAAGRAWHFSHSLGRNTAEHNGRTGGFAHPMDVAAAGDGIIFVINRGGGFEIRGYGGDMAMRIGKMTIDEEHLGDFARGGFTWPTSIDVAGDGTVFVSDEHENSISFYDPDGIVAFPDFDPDGEELGRWGVAGSEEGKLSGPTGIEFDDQDDLFVVDSLNNRVQKFTKDGRFISAWGGPGDADGEFNRPWGIAIDREGYVYVADWGNHRVQKFTPGGEHRLTFSGVPGDSLEHPSTVAVDSEGDVYVVDWGNKRVQIFEPEGDLITSLYGDATEFSKAGIYNINRDPEFIKQLNESPGTMAYLSRFGRPIGIEVDEKDRVIVTDARGRLLVYAKDKDYVPPPN